MIQQKRNIRIRNKKIGIIGFPIDLGADRRGVDMGPSAIRYSHLRSKLEKLGYQVKDFGDISIEIFETQSVRNPKLKYLPEITRSSKILAARVEHLLEKHFFPLVLGGDHSVAIGSIAGISAYCRSHSKIPGLIWIDAHSDMNTEETTPSGNIHGMPLAVSLGSGHKMLTRILGFSPKIKPENTAIIGVRDVDFLESGTVKMFKKKGMQVYTMSDVDKLGIPRIIAKVLSDFNKRVEHLHVSFDLDGVDPEYAQGVGTPVNGGLTYRESQTLMEMIADCGCMKSLEIVEVNPILDIHNKTAELATELIASALGKNTLYY